MVILTALMMLLPLASLGQEMQIPEQHENLNGNVIVFPTILNCNFSLYYHLYPEPLVNLKKSSVICSPRISTKVKDYTISSELGNYFFTLDFSLRKGKGRFYKATITFDTTTGPENSDNAKFFDDATISYPGCLYCLTKHALMCIPLCFPENPAKCLACIVENALECLTPCGFSKIHQQLEGISVAENGTEILVESDPPRPGTCTAHLHWFECVFTNQYCNTAAGYSGHNWYSSSHARCCCNCCTATGSCGTTTC